MFNNTQRIWDNDGSNNKKWTQQQLTPGICLVKPPTSVSVEGYLYSCFCTAQICVCTRPWLRFMARTLACSGTGNVWQMEHCSQWQEEEVILQKAINLQKPSQTSLRRHLSRRKCCLPKLIVDDSFNWSLKSVMSSLSLPFMSRHWVNNYY